MKKISVILSVAVMAAGCVQPAGPVIHTQLGMLQGQPANSLFYKLGYPTGESVVANTKFYYWSSSAVIMQPTTIDTTGFAQVGHKTVAYNQTTFGPDQPVPIGCTIRVFVDRNERIISHDLTGNQGGCAPYAQRLDPTYKPGPF